jgi:hypothetical protein
VDVPRGSNLFYNDVNSLYPFVMQNSPMPIGKATWNANPFLYSRLSSFVYRGDILIIFLASWWLVTRLELRNSTLAYTILPPCRLVSFHPPRW